MSPVLIQTTILFVLILIGYIIKKIKVISDELVQGLSSFIINVTLPMMIIASMNYEFSKEMMINSVLILALGIVSYAIAILLANIFTRIFHVDEPQKGVYKFLLLLSNTGFMGFPVLNALYGSEGIFYGAIFNILFNIVLWTIGIDVVTRYQYEGKKKATHNTKHRLKKLIVNPGIISVIIGLIVFISPVKLPMLILSPIKLVGDTTTPLAMMVVGALLADVKIGDMFTNYRLYIISAIRLIILPTILVFIFSFFKLPHIVSGIVVVLSGMPSAANVAIFAKNYNSDYKLASQGVFITTMLNMATVPLILYLISTI